MQQASRCLLAGVLALACGPSASLPDAAPDAPSTTLRVRIEAPRFAFAGEPVCFRARLEGHPLASVEWVFGDGETRRVEGARDGDEQCHTFAFVGGQVVGVTVQSEGTRAEATHALAVVFRPSDPAPTHSSPMAQAGGQLYVVDPDAGTLAVLAEVPLSTTRIESVCLEPRTVAAGSERLAIACQGDGRVLLRELDGAPAGEVALGPGTEPYGVVHDPRGGGFFVSLQGTGELAHITPDGTLDARIPLGPDPRGLGMNADGTLVVSRWRATASGAHVYTVDARAPSLPVSLGETELPAQEGLDADTDNSGVLSFLDSVVPSPDGRRAILPGLKANTVTGVFNTGAPLTSQTTARAALGEVSMGPPPALATDSFRYAFDDLGLASAAVFSPVGDRLYVTFSGAQTVVGVDAFDFFSVTSIDDVGETPRALAISEDGLTLFVWAFLSRTVRAYGLGDGTSEPALIGEARVVEDEPLSPSVLEGKRIFYRSRDPRMSRTRYLSCASCHLDGEQDGLVWDFTQRGEGLRNTIGLRGSAAPFHWSANFDEAQDFEGDIRDHQGGTGFLTDAEFTRGGPLEAPRAGLSPELDALRDYLESLTDLPRSPVSDPPPRGRTLFEARCASCHAGPRFSDSALVDGVPVLHDVGTLGAGSGQRLGETLAGLDTPTLRGVWRSGPYLHDGSAPTLRDVLTTRNAADRHGVTSDLSDDDLDALVQYLRSLR